MMNWKRLMGLLALCLLLTGCVSALPFDPETEGVLDVIVRDGETVAYYAVSGDGRKREIPAFGGDGIRVYRPDVQGIECYLSEDDRGRRAFINRLTDVRLWDETGAAVENTRLMNEILLAAAELEHDLFDVKLICSGNEWFVYAALNVNWVSPCDLYWYDQARGGLVEVYSFDHQEVVGLRMRDLSRLAARPLYRPEHPPRREPPRAQLDALLADFEEHRDLCTAAMNVLYAHPELFDLLRQDQRVNLTAPDGTRYYFSTDNRDERFCHADPALFNAPERDENGNLTERGWEQHHARMAVRHVPFAYFADKGVLTAAEMQQVQAMLEAMKPVYVGQEGAVLLHYALMDGSGQTWVTRLYYAPEAETAAACSAAWPVWESLGGGWYLAALEDGLR